MIFLSPLLLIALFLVPLLVAVYVWALRRRRKFAVRYSSLSLIREALPRRSRWRQHLPFALFMLGLAFLMVAMARPTAEVEVPLSRTSIILALDVSRSMCATDISPNRLVVAQEAALNFVDGQADGTQMGIVAFAGFAELIVPPTNDKKVLKDAIVNLTVSLGTAIGSATLKSIDAIAEVNTAVAPSGLFLGGDEGRVVPEGFYQPDIIVLLTDGRNSQGPFPLDAAQQAADRGVRIYTIGFGTTNPTDMVCTRQQVGSDPFGNEFGGFGSGGGPPGGIGGNFRRFLILDEPTLQGVAEITGGSYFRAENAEQLQEIFADLPTQIVLQKEQFELSVVFLLAGGLFASLAIGLSLKWNRFP